MTERRNPLLVDEAEALLGHDRTLNLDEKQDGRRWPNYLAMYRATGRPEHLAQARTRADEYLKLRVDARHASAHVKGSAFVTDDGTATGSKWRSGWVAKGDVSAVGTVRLPRGKVFDLNAGIGTDQMGNGGTFKAGDIRGC